MPAALPRLLGAALVVATAHAAAASFDCKLARSTTEHAICNSPALSALDERLARRYERVLQALSPEGARLQKDAQRRWLRFATRACTVRSGGKPPAPADVASCLESTYGKRLDQLEMAGLRVGPWLINRIDLVEASPAAKDDDTGEYPGIAFQHVAFAQIDAPRTPATLAWNAKHLKTLAPGDDAVPEADAQPEDDDTDLVIGCASERFISIDRVTLEYIKGTPHGQTSHEVDNMVLAPGLRAMTAADVFAPGADWRGKLPALFWKAYQGRDEADKDEGSPEIRDGIRQAAVNPGHWLLTPDGLQMSFDSDELGCYACNPGPLTVSWASLKPLLANADLATCQAPPPARR